MNTEKRKQLTYFIEKKRREDQSDDLIMEELVNSGWNKKEVLTVLAGDDIPAPPETSQTGSEDKPTQIENVQYSVKVGKVRSKVGLATTVSAISGWILAFMIMVVIVTINATIFDRDATDLKETLVFVIAVCVPVAPIMYLAVKRMNKALVENPANMDDVYFKKSVRFHFIAGLIWSIFWAITAVYNLLSKMVLADTEITAKMIADSFGFLLPVALLTYFFWTYQQKTKR